jgi:hypothetical protein
MNLHVDDKDFMADELFELGWSIPDVAKELGITQEESTEMYRLHSSRVFSGEI